MPTHEVNISRWNIPETCILADPSFNRPGTIDIIVGASHFFEILRTGRLSLGDNMPTLHETEFGWIVSGSATIAEPLSPVMCAMTTHTNQLDNIMKQFFAIEDLSTTPNWSIEERACEDHFTTTTTRDGDGRYVVQLPRKPELVGKLGDSRTIALRRFLAIERRLQREPDTQRAYIAFMDEYLRLGHMSKVADSSVNDESFYLPHHPVFKADSTTTKCRVVFDASSKSSTGVSLNDTLMVGPTIQQDATSILMRFRTQPVALTADVAKMYRQVWIHPKDRSLQRILWRKSPTEPVQEYELNTVTYGTASAPFLAVRALQQTVKDHGNEFPAAATRSCDFYVDDFVSGGQTAEAVQMLQFQTEQLYAKAGFELRKWASSEPSILQHMNQEKLASSPYATGSTEGVLATLGLIWDPSSDTLQFKINSSNEVGEITKRKVLSCIARIYDPLGIVDPVKAMAKQFLQRIWTLQTDQQKTWGWDDALPNSLQGEWINFHNQLTYLQKLRIPRVAIGPATTSSQFHFFCDASEKGYGACCYIRSRDDQGNITMQLYASKTKVTPISSKHSIARLELCAAQLASLLYERVKTAVELKTPATFWTDSMTVVHWLRASPRCWKPFVANRVSQIQHLTQGGVWRHIPGVDNPADLASRGCLSKDLLNNPLWWQGPSWICQPEDQWPESSVSSICEAAAAEQRSTRVACPVIERSPHRIFTLFSSFSKLRRIMAYWVQYFNRRFKRRKYAGIGLTTQDLKEAEEVLCRLAQKEHFELELKALQRNDPIHSSSKLKWLHPQLGANGIIRVGGRLSNSSLPEDTKHPIVVPNGHPLARLLMDYFHKTLLHAGPQLMLSTSRQRYWILGGRNTAKRVYHQCVTCFRAKPSTSETIMADLPSSRVTPSRPFSITGIDYCGPVFVKGPHRRAVATKAYVAIFVCFTTRAVHIELVSNLTTEAFLSALRRFIARRGLPEQLHSDNATNFKGANNKLNELYKLLHTTEHQQSVQTWMLEKQITWKFIPPRAPHFGGIWEAAVRSMKHHLVRVLGASTLSFEDMATLLAEIECCLNSRPLTPMTDDPCDATALTPGHFLVGSHLQQIPDSETTDAPENRLTHWRHIQQLKRHFWKRWHQEYLQQLQPRSKWRTDGTAAIAPGTLVIIKEDNVPPTSWPLARVIEIHPGTDGKTRVVTLQTSAKTQIVRPLVRLCVLPKAEENC